MTSIQGCRSPTKLSAQPCEEVNYLICTMWHSWIFHMILFFIQYNPGVEMCTSLTIFHIYASSQQNIMYCNLIGTVSSFMFLLWVGVGCSAQCGSLLHVSVLQDGRDMDTNEIWVPTNLLGIKIKVSTINIAYLCFHP